MIRLAPALARERGTTPVPRESGNEGEHDVYSNQYDG